jgi:hypothetical protein
MIAKVTYQKTVLLVEIKKNDMSYLNQFKKETKSLIYHWPKNEIRLLKKHSKL